jgi:FtsP/CotA-like multicopper oxidase with cupredoxin domain
VGVPGRRPGEAPRRRAELRRDLVDPADAEAWPPVDREAIVTLDDVLIEDGRIAPFRVEGPTHTAMGRFGNVMLTGGSTDLRLEARTGEVVRLYFTNTANTRIFNVSISGSRMKLVGGDSGRYEREREVEAILLAPSERAVVDVLFERAGSFPLEHRTPETAYNLGSVEVTDGEARPPSVEAFATLHENGELVGERARLAAELERTPDKTLVFDAEMPLLYGGQDDVTASVWTCPMHPDVTSTESGTCPICGMKLVPADPSAAGPGGHGHDHHHAHDTGDGLEWEDLMPEINAQTDATNMIWKLVDHDTGRANADIDWSFQVGDRVKIRLVNTMDSDHPMHHPFHIHGAGRFLVIARDDVPEPNLVWKDTVLVRAGETVDILLAVTSPGLWMAHCHIAEHNQNGMMFSFGVEPG